MGIYVAQEMRNQGITVYDSIQDAPQSRAASAQVLEFTNERTPGLTNVVAWASVPTHGRGWWKGQVPVILTMWEATELPISFRENLHEFDTVIVPSQQNLELFSRYHNNVKYVPLGVDTERWFPVERRPPLTRFNFLCGGSGARKGTDLAVAAFKKAFPNGSWGDDQPVPYLVLKQPKNEDWYGDRIERITGYMDGPAERAVYADAHCYLQPSRGEGFGLQPLQAIAQGIPTILTDAHGHKSFSHLGMGIGSSLVKAGYFIYGDAGDWWEPDLDELVDTMRWVYNNYDEAQKQAWTNAKRVPLEGFTWSKCAANFVEAIGVDRLCEPYSGPGEWYEPTAKMYPVITLYDHTCDIAGHRYVFEKGVEQYTLADVKRILFEGGHLDPACLVGDDEGLHPDQVRRLPGYLERVSWCPTCKQKLGSGITQADVIMAEDPPPL